MVTPQELQEKTFTKAVFGGYDMASVDDYLEEVSADIAALGKENAILKSKIKVLVEKVEEYRNTEDAMRMALLTAQKTRDEIIADANSKKDRIMSEAEKAAAEKISAIREEIRTEREKLAAAKQETAKFVDSARTLCEGQVAFLENLDKLELPDLHKLRRTSPAAPTVRAEPAPEAPVEPEPVPEAVPQHQEKPAADSIDDAAASIAANMRRMEDEVPDETTAAGSYEEVARQARRSTEPVPPEFAAVENEFAARRENDRRAMEETGRTRLFKKLSTEEIWDDDEPTSPRPKFNFDDLKFGANYENNEK